MAAMQFITMLSNETFFVCLSCYVMPGPPPAAAGEPGGAALPGAAGPQGRVLEEAGGAAAL